jgi:adenylyl-sulfate kinase
VDNNFRGFTVWFTGLPSAGKSTASVLLAAELRARGLKIEVLDGDAVRTNLSQGLGFSREDRIINVKRIGFVCELLSRNGVVAIAAVIAPYREARDYNRVKIGDYVEVFCKCPLEVLIERDVKGLYKKALAGEVKNLTGLQDPYEEPENAEITICTDCEKPEESVGKIVRHLEELGYIPYQSADYDAEEEAAIEKRLEDLGYL